MTTTHHPNSDPVSMTGAVDGSPPMDRARRLLRFDSLLCLGSGALLALGAPVLTDVAGVEAIAPTVVAGIFLLVLGAGLALLARADWRLITTFLPWSGDGDLLWTAGSVAVVAAVDLTGPGRAVVLAQAVVVAAIGVLKLRLARQARRALGGA